MLEKFRTDVENFFELPYEEKKKLWQQPDNHEGFGQLFVVSEQQKLDWSDMFYITTLPLNLRKTELFEKLPVELRFATPSLQLKFYRFLGEVLTHGTLKLSVFESPIWLQKYFGRLLHGIEQASHGDIRLHG